MVLQEGVREDGAGGGLAEDGAAVRPPRLLLLPRAVSDRWVQNLTIAASRSSGARSHPDLSHLTSEDLQKSQNVFVDFLGIKETQLRTFGYNLPCINYTEIFRLITHLTWINMI